ncbi:ABC transporter permease [Rhizobium sp.]|jgi:putative spermidine/putrescine transport system permease protein|uniref:ABC transporter permease n=1 Tax=Rhizobium sp. TaxID=391 RepID=UPI000E8682F5|nr:ABC transporter permease [Rhizobium sp.]
MRLSNFLLYVVVGLILVWLVVPILIVIPMSFSGARFLAFPPPSWSLRWYQSYLDNAAWMQATKVTLVIAFSSSIIATVLGTAAAYGLNMTASRLVRSLQMVLLLPLIVPIVITAVGVFLVYANVGLIATMTGLILANVMLGLPYVVTSVLVGLRKFDPAQEMVSRSLGMNRFRTFFAVTLPQIRPSVISGALFAFISAMDETVVALFISGGEYQTLTKRMFTALRDEIDPTIAAISTLLTATSFILLMLVTIHAQRHQKKQGKMA